MLSVNPEQKMVSIIIPCYNGTAFIEETLDSILSQDAGTFEIILVDDGSTDNLRDKIKHFATPALKYFRQENRGVSAARNRGLEQASGSNIIFFDADDKMSAGFIRCREEILLAEPNVAFVSGPTFDFNKQVIGHPRRGAVTAEEILLYDRMVSTCPSNYMFRRNFLETHQLRFNESLSSTADRFFLLCCLNFGKGFFGENAPPLYYRVSETSMSAKLTPSLVKDNEKYYKELERDNLIPEKIKTASRFLGYSILSKSNFKTGDYRNGFFYAFKCVLTKLSV